MITFDFQEQVAVVTGGAKGIGLAAAQRLQESGAHIVIWDLDAIDDGMIGQLGLDPDRTIAIQVDVSRWDDVERAANESIAWRGHVDVLVAAAGIAGLFEDAEKYPLDDWDRVLAVNLSGVYFSNRAFLPHMKERGYGRIVNIASVAGKEGNPRQVAYSTSKAAVIGMMKSIGKETTSSGVTVNALAPAVFDTPMVQELDQQDLESIARRIPMGRVGRPEEAASMICWIASKDCSFTTGFTFDITGGRATY